MTLEELKTALCSGANSLIQEVQTVDEIHEKDGWLVVPMCDSAPCIVRDETEGLVNKYRVATLFPDNYTKEQFADVLDETIRLATTHANNGHMPEGKKDIFLCATLASVEDVQVYIWEL